MYLGIERHDGAAVAAIDAVGNRITYGELRDFANEMARAAGGRTLIFIMCENGIGSLAGYYGAMQSRIVPLLLGAGIKGELLSGLIQTYRPEYIWVPEKYCNEILKNLDEINVRTGGDAGQDRAETVMSKYGNILLYTGFDKTPMYGELSLLLTTSGSTGSPKLVRHSYANLEANARNIAAFFGLNEGERPMVDLPMQYTYGLSVINSHLFAGATLLLSNLSLMRSEYWDFFTEERATSFTGVPYSYGILKRLRFFSMELPALRTLSQGGGRLSENLQREFAQYALDTGRRFIITYGQTEGSARMAYLPAEYALEKIGSIGRAIPGGELSIATEDGEMAYRGPNVTLGYASCRDDLLKGDERGGYLLTGDIARRDADGFYYILGRKARFVKLQGCRVGLDECELLVREHFGIDCACTGVDDRLTVFVANRQGNDTADADNGANIRRFLMKSTGLQGSMFEVRDIQEIPRNAAGKTLYSRLAEKTAGES